MVGFMKPFDQWLFSSKSGGNFHGSEYLSSILFSPGAFSMYKALEYYPLNLYPKVNSELVKDKTNAPNSLSPAGGLRGDLVAGTAAGLVPLSSAGGQRVKTATNLPASCFIFIKSSFSSGLRKSNAALNPISRH